MVKSRNKGRSNVVSIHKVREAVANYRRSEGCACCRDYEAHKKHSKVLGELLRIPEYDDGSGHDFGQFTTEELNNADKKRKASKGSKTS